MLLSFLTESSGDVVFCEFILRIREDSGGEIVFNQFPQIEKGTVVRDPGSLLHIVGNNEDTVI
jgi:hypothetical protein